MSESVDGDGQRVLRVESARDPWRMCLTAVTDLDVVSESRARAELDRALSGGCQECLVDVSGVFVDLRGLTVLLDAAACAEERGCRLAVAPCPSVLTLSRALGLGSRLRLVGGRSDGDGLDRR